MRRLLTAAVVAVSVLTPAAAAAQSSAAVQEADSASAAVATVMGPLVNRNLVTLRGLGLEIDNAAFVRALSQFLEGGDTGFTPESADAWIDARVRRMHPEMAVDTVSVQSQADFIAGIAKTPGAVTLPGGTVFVVIQEGEGAKPTDTDKVVVAYRGQLADGTVFDSTEEGGTVTFDVNRLVKGFTEGLKEMKPGGTYRIVIPAPQGYGDRGIPGVIPGNAALDFTVTLVSVEKQ